MTTDIETPASPPSSALRIAVIILALIKVISSLTDLGAFANMSEYAGKGFAQYLLLAGLAIYPFLAVPALIFAFKGDIRRAIMLLAAMVIVGFVTNSFPALFIHGLELSGSAAVTLDYLARLAIFPLLAVVAFVLARRNEKLCLATLFVCLPTIANILGVIAFGVGVMLHGF